MDHIVILSDDLTGANDSGVQFAKHGIPTIVCIDDRHIVEPAADGLTCVINVESRSLPAKAAYQKWHELLSRIDLGKFQVIFKKVDSTLRGNIGIEIQALMDSGHFELAFVAPAYPQKGRFTIGGYQLVHQHLLEDSEISRDPKFPITNSKISDIIRQQLTMPVGDIEIRDIRSGKIRTRMDQLKQEGVRVMVADSATEQDLQIIAEQVADTKVLWVGSAGLAEALAHRYPHRGFEAEQTDARLGGKSKTAPVLVVAGSVSGVTLKQVETLKLNGFRSIEIDPVLLLDESKSDIETEELITKAQRILTAGNDLVISTNVSSEKRQQVTEYTVQADISVADGGDRIADRMGIVAAALIRNESLSGAVLTGGDIAYRTCKHLNIVSLKITGEVEEGLPLCRAEGQVNIPLVTKAGAFGNPESLLRAAKVMKFGGNEA